MTNQRLLVSRNQREGHYAGYYPSETGSNKGRHKRWTYFSATEFYPRISGSIYYELQMRYRQVSEIMTMELSDNSRMQLKKLVGIHILKHSRYKE